MYYLLILISSLMILSGCQQQTQETVLSGGEDATGTQQQLPSQDFGKHEMMTLALAAPRAGDEYYAERYDDIIDFLSGYASRIIKEGKDRVVIFADEKAKKELSKTLSADIFIDYSQQDIWMRDFTLTNPTKPIQRRYTATAQRGKQSDSDYVQNHFNKRLSPNYEIKKTPLEMDGGNIVDNYLGDVIVTDRFLIDNKLSYDEGVTQLKEIMGAKRVAIIENDDPKGLAHADGMVAWIDDKVLAMNEYDEPLRTNVRNELQKSFPDVTIIEVEAKFDEEVWDERMSSACGINLNSVMTKQALYVPHFGTSHDDKVIATIKEHTTKTVIPVPAKQVCSMGGSVRCLTWQSMGSLAEHISAQVNNTKSISK